MSGFGWIFQKPEASSWRSEWRKEFERRSAEESLKPRATVKAAHTVERVKKNYSGRVRVYSRTCASCPKKIRTENLTGRCWDHRLNLLKERPDAKTCGTGCGKTLNKNASYGLCKLCYIKYRRLIHQDKRRQCAEPGCLNRLRIDCQWDKCRTHSKTLRSAQENSIKKQRRHELKVAA